LLVATTADIEYATRREKTVERRNQLCAGQFDWADWANRVAC
jgi:hypothetical protein